jgi:methionyl-tRNA formyltransferase
MRILFAGTPLTAATVLEGLLASGHEIVTVLTREDSLTGRKKILTPSPVASLAEKHGIPTIKANKLTTEVLKEIRAHKVDLAVVVAYGVILRQEALDAIASGWFNLHFSILPKWRGAAPVQASIRAGDSETGVTLFRIDLGLDTGPVLGSVRTVIEPGENAGELLHRLSLLGLTLINQELPRLYSGAFELTPQEGEATLAPKITRSDAKLSFLENAERLALLVRAMNPEPMAWCLLNGEPMRVLEARALNASSALHSGEVAIEEDKVIVGCGQGTVLELIVVQPASKTAMSARDWLNGQAEKVVLE